MLIIRNHNYPTANKGLVGSPSMRLFNSPHLSKEHLMPCSTPHQNRQYSIKWTTNGAHTFYNTAFILITTATQRT